MLDCVVCVYVLYVIRFNNNNVPIALTTKTFENDLNNKVETAVKQLTTRRKKQENKDS